MFLSPMQSSTNLAQQGEIRRMEGITAFVERADLILESYNIFQDKLKAIVNFPQQAEKLLEEINLLFTNRVLSENSAKELAKVLINFSNQIAKLETIDLNPNVTTCIQKVKDAKLLIGAVGQVVDAKVGQHKNLMALVEGFFDKINGFNPWQRNQQGGYLLHFFAMDLRADFDRLDALYLQFDRENASILQQREKNINQLKVELESLREKVSPFLFDSSDNLVTTELDKLQKDLSELGICVEKNIKDANDRLQEIKKTIEVPIANAATKSKLLNFLRADDNPISTIRDYTAKLNQAGKMAQAKASAFSSIIEKFNLIQDCAYTTSDGVSSKEMVDKVQVLEDEIRNQRNTLAQYRGVAFFRPLMRCIGKGEVTSLEHVAQLEHAIKGFKSSVTSAI